MSPGPGLAAGVGGGGGSWLVGDSSSVEGVIMFGVGGPLGRVCASFSILAGSRVLLVSSVRVERVGEEAPASSKLTVEALRSVRLNGL
jgi:hypothetical protein